MGYDPAFLGGEPIALPDLSERLAHDAFNGGRPLEHTRFSVVFHRVRGLAICTAHNIDGARMLPAGAIRRRDRFRADDQVPGELQIDNRRGYRNNPWDRGHLTRRRSLHWGEEDEARRADDESYVWTNIAPQHERLHQTAWGPIEDWMLERTEDSGGRAAVFQGPVMTPDDPLHINGENERPIRIPAGFWKVIATEHEGGRTAAAFVVWQRDHDSAYPVSFSPHLEQVRITTLEFLTGLSFPALRVLDPLRFDDREGTRDTTRRGGLQPAERAADTATATRTVRPPAVLEPGDIVI